MNAWDAIERLARLRLRAGGLRGRTVETAAGPMFAYDAPGRGPRPPLVLLHGIGSSATAYGKLMLGLLPHVRRLMAPDLPGHGFSATPPPGFDPEALVEQAIGLVDALLDEPAVVVGTSMGGGLALRYAIARPARVRALVLCSPAGAPMSAEALDTLRAQFELAGPADARAFVERLFADRPPAPALVARAVRDRLTRPVVRDLLARVGPETFLTAEEAATLAPPTLLLWGGAERVLPEESLAWLRAHLPEAVQIERPAGWGHSAHLEQTGALVERVVRFVDQTLPASDAGSCPEGPGEAPSG